jgi:GxxExxY protein
VLARLPTDNLTREIIAAAIEVHREFGPGLLESVYSECLRHELSARKLTVATERRVPVVYKDARLDCEFRLDLLVANVVVEVKAIAAVLPIHQAQLLTYLKLTGLPVGLIINFNVERLVDGVKRVINPSPDPKRAAAVGLPPAAR